MNESTRQKKLSTQLMGEHLLRIALRSIAICNFSYRKNDCVCEQRTMHARIDNANERKENNRLKCIDRAAFNYRKLQRKP